MVSRWVPSFLYVVNVVKERKRNISKEFALLGKENYWCYFSLLEYVTKL